MANELAVKEVNPLLILQQAVDKGVDTEQLTALMGLAERWDANVARKAFNVAFSEFKAEAVTIVKNVEVKDGPLKGKNYADLFGVVNVVTPVMSKHGLSHSWKLTKDDPTWMEVTCTIRHILGHAESVSMGAAPDTGPGRNAIQARGSAKSYLERYTLLAATGMAASDEDNDGNGAPPKDVGEYIAEMVKANNEDDLKTLFGSAYRLFAKSKDDQTKIKAEYDKRKAELTGKKEGGK